MQAIKKLTCSDQSSSLEARVTLEQLEKLRLHAGNYRDAVDHILSPEVRTSENWQACLYQILISVARLYLDYLLIQHDFSTLETIASKRARFKILPTDGDRESKLREDLKKRFLLPDSWPGFVPNNPFSQSTSLRHKQDYEASLTLHLPEIYEESFRVETCAKAFLESHSDSALAQLSVGLLHLGRNHISFLLPTLEWAAHEGSWDQMLKEGS